MMSWGGTSSTTVRRLTRAMRSMGHATRMSPGPLARGRSFPRRKMTPRSYSLRIFTERRIQKTMTKTMMPAPIRPPCGP